MTKKNDPTCNGYHNHCSACNECLLCGVFVGVMDMEIGETKHFCNKCSDAGKHKDPEPVND